MSVYHRSVLLQTGLGPTEVYLLEGPHVLYIGEVYGVFSRWEDLLEHCETGANLAIGMISHRFLTAEQSENGRMHATLLECKYVPPVEQL